MLPVPSYDLSLMSAALMDGLAEAEIVATIIEVGDSQDVSRALSMAAAAIILIWSDGASEDGEGRARERIGVLHLLRDATPDGGATRGAKLRTLLAATRQVLDNVRTPGADLRWEPPRWREGALFDLGDTPNLRHAWRDTYVATWHRTLGGRV